MSQRSLERSGADHLARLLVGRGFRHATSVPGWPATALQEALAAHGAEVIDGGNERSAAELAFGWSAAGRPALVVVKGSGTWLAAEAVQNMTVHGVGAPVLVLIGDDIDASSSTVALDSRPLGPIAAAVVVDAVAGSAGDAAVLAAVEASQRHRRPSIVRFSARLADASVTATSGDIGALTGAAALEPGGSAHRVTKWSRQDAATATWQPEVLERWPDPVVSLRTGDVAAPIGIVVAGEARHDALAAADEGVPVCGVELVHPFPAAAIARFAATVGRLVVVEDGSPFVEDQVELAIARAGGTTPVLGQRSGHLRPRGPATVEEIKRALAPGSALRPPGQSPPVEHRSAAPTPFDPVLRALKTVSGEAPCSIHTCVGSCIAAAYPPYSMATTALELGASIAVASGAAMASGQPAVALIGDYGLIHSALEDHDLVYRSSWPVLTIVLADGRSAKTGGQPSACSPATPGARPLPLRTVLDRVAGADRVVVIDGDTTSEPELVNALRTSLQDLPRTIIVTTGDDVHLT